MTCVLWLVSKSHKTYIKYLCVLFFCWSYFATESPVSETQMSEKSNIFCLSYIANTPTPNGSYMYNWNLRRSWEHRQHEDLAPTLISLLFSVKFSPSRITTVFIEFQKFKLNLSMTPCVCEFCPNINTLIGPPCANVSTTPWKRKCVLRNRISTNTSG